MLNIKIPDFNFSKNYKQNIQKFKIQLEKISNDFAVILIVGT